MCMCLRAVPIMDTNNKRDTIVNHIFRIFPMTWNLKLNHSFRSVGFFRSSIPQFSYESFRSVHSMMLFQQTFTRTKYYMCDV